LPVAIYIAGQNIGPACGALLGTKILATAGWRLLFAVTGLGALLWAPFWLYFARFETTNLKPVTETATKHNWSAILASPALWSISSAVFFFSYYWYFVLTWVPTYLNLARGLPLETMGKILFVPLFVMAPVNIAVGLLADRIIARNGRALHVRLWFAATGFAGAGAILFLQHVQAQAAILAVLIFSTSSFGIGSSSFWALVQHLAPPYLTARVIGYFNTLSQLAGAVAPIITGYTLGPEKNFEIAILLAGASTVFASCILLATRPRRAGDFRTRLEAG
jgi:MFS family permease